MSDGRYLKISRSHISPRTWYGLAAGEVPGVASLRVLTATDDLPTLMVWVPDPEDITLDVEDKMGQNVRFPDEVREDAALVAMLRYAASRGVSLLLVGRHYAPVSDLMTWGDQW